LQQEIKIGIAAANRGEFVDAEEVFSGLRKKLQAKRAQAGK
jgi:predicted transcriptional regulator